MQPIAELARNLVLVLYAVSASVAVATSSVVTPCNESTFNSVLSTVVGNGGGNITFACGASPATIVFSSVPYRAISNNASVVIDGGNLVTLDGNSSVAFFQVSNGTSLTLRNLHLQHGVFNNVHALENFGTLTLDHASMSSNSGAYSAIYNSGDLVVLSGTLSNNTLNGTAETLGAAIYGGSGNISISSSTFSTNTISSNVGNGGAIEVDGGAVNIAHTTFSSNTASNGGALGLGAGVTALIESSTFNANIASTGGGAIVNSGAQVTLNTTAFTQNSAGSSDGGAIFNLTGTLNADGVQFTGNNAARGGAISCNYSASPNPDSGMTLNNSSFGGNNATGGAIFGGGAVWADCTTNASNDTFSANTATSPGEGGAIIQGDDAPAVTVAFSTIVGNTAIAGAGLTGSSLGTHRLLIGTSIVSANTGGNCAGLINSFGYNVSDNNDCGGDFTAIGDLLSAYVPVLAYGNYGGPTSTRPPDTSSVITPNAAENHVPLALCNPKFDQRGGVRPAGAQCDSGAVELAAILDSIFKNGFDLF